MSDLLALVEHGPLDHGGLAALQLGTAVEQGADPAPLGQVLLAKVPSVLRAAGRLVQAVEEELGSVPPMPRGPGGLWVGDLFAPKAWLDARREHDADSVVAFEGLPHWCLPTIACLTRSRSLLERAVADPSLAAALGPLTPVQPHAAFLGHLCALLLDAEVIVHHRSTGRRFRVGLDGVALNFELHSLLHHVLASELGLPSLDPAVLACLDGTGPQQIDTVSVGTWSLYAEGALSYEKEVPRAHWVWNEGRPTDIPVNDAGERVLVLAEAAFDRTWNTCRTFEALTPRVWLKGELPRG